MNTFYACGLEGLDLWMFEMFFLVFITSDILNSPIYKHQYCAVFFVLIFCTIIKFFSTLIAYLDDKGKIYKTYKIIIPIGIIIFLAITYLRSYVTCKVKWLMDLKYISSSRLLMIYGLMGFIICSLAGIITTLVSCKAGLISYEEMVYICRQTRTLFFENNQNFTYNYYDSYSVYKE